MLFVTTAYTCLPDTAELVRLCAHSLLLPKPLHQICSPTSSLAVILDQLDHGNQAVESTSSAGKYPTGCYISMQLVTIGLPIQLNGANVKDGVGTHSQGRERG